MKNKNIMAVMNLIRCLDFESLRDPVVVANLIRAFGLVQWNNNTFGKEEIFRNPSPEMAGIYQMPDQMGKALAYLSRHEIGSYCEIGVFQGGNFVFVSEYLRRFNPQIQCLGIDPSDYLNPEIKTIIDSNSWLDYKKLTTDSIQGAGFDLVFIDGDHQGGWVKRDWQNVGQHANICMFHDIQGPVCPEVVAFWNEIKTGKKALEFLDPGPYQGIGITHNR